MPSPAPTRAPVTTTLSPAHPLALARGTSPDDAYEAFEAYERAAKLDPSLGDDLFFKLGNIAFKRRDHARARESWTRATELNPAHQLARANLDLLEAAT